MSCIFCNTCLEDGQATVSLRQKGCDAINSLVNTLGLTFTVIPGQTVHTVCRRDFCRQKELRRTGNHDQNLSEEYRRLRSGGGFDFEKHCLFCGQSASIGQAIVQTVRPRMTLPPLQLGLAVQLHNQYSSRFLIDILNKLGFCTTYKEVMRFESSAAVANGVLISGVTSSNFLQFAADNVDHNIRTLDGHDTFHGMGIIAAVTPGVTEKAPIPRIHVSNEDLVSSGKINIKFYKTSLERPCIILKDLKIRNIQDPTECLDIILKITRPLKPSTPGWSGFMQFVEDGNFPGRSSIKFLPMIDLNPSDLSCIYSTLCFVCTEARRYHTTPIVTFDQPLYWKASTIIQNESNDSELNNVFLRLGGFHMQMSFLGSIGHLMLASGLQDVLETVYASNAVDHMMSGKAVSRAVRGHLLVDSALNMILTSDIYGVPLPTEPNQTNDEDTDTADIPQDVTVNESLLTYLPQDNMTDVAEVHTDLTGEHSETTNIHIYLQTVTALYDQLMSKEISPDSVEDHEVFGHIKKKFEAKLLQLKSYPTSCLWVQYMEMIEILKQFIKAERTGNWELHLQAVKHMLPYLAATGHNLYVKSAYLYLQQMNDLQESHPDIYDKFVNGFHIIRHSDRYWAGLSTDLTIEQTLMRTLKSTGGMTRGKGMSEVQRAQWLLSMPVCAAINSSIQALTDISYQTSEQHKDCSQSRLERDTKDRNKILAFLDERKPFATVNFLRNIETGVTSTGDVNAHQARKIGSAIVKDMKGQNVIEVSFKRSRQVVPLKTHSTLQVGNEVVPVSPQLLFQRLLVAATGKADDMSHVFIRPKGRIM